MDDPLDLKHQSESLALQKNSMPGMGGAATIARQHAVGKLTARERLDCLCDPGSFEELGILVHHTDDISDMRDRATPADGVITGFGRILGRPAAIIAYDVAVMAGSMGLNGEVKVARLRQAALARLIPIVWLLDSAGAGIQELAGSQFAGSGSLFKEQATMSGIVPQVAAVMGATAARTSYIAALADFVPIVVGLDTTSLSGPSLVKAAVGEVAPFDELGGSRVHTTKSGVAHLECPDDRSCIDAIKAYLSYMPSNFRSPLPTPPLSDIRALRRSDDVFKILPESMRKVYDMRQIIRWLVDEHSFFELQPDWAKNMLIGFARIGGFSVGIVANQPSVMGGAIDIDAADKATRFINLCDAFGMPLVFLHDCPGFLVGSRMEHQGVIGHGTKMLFAVSLITSPKLSIIVRKSYGAGYYVMCGKGYDPDLIVAWPGADISLMSPESAANITSKDDVDKSRVAAHLRTLTSAVRAARSALIDDVIDPRDTAQIIAQHLTILLPKHNFDRQNLKTKKHGVTPV